MFSEVRSRETTIPKGLLRVDEKSMAILHPTSLKIFSASIHHDFVQICENIVFPLPRPVSNMTCVKSLGKKRSPNQSFAVSIFCILDRDGICVQSLDGDVYFVQEGNLASMMSCWREHLVAGPLLHIPYNDTIITSTSKFEVVCYRRSSLFPHSTSPSSKLVNAVPF